MSDVFFFVLLSVGAVECVVFEFQNVNGRFVHMSKFVHNSRAISRNSLVTLTVEKLFRFVSHVLYSS